MNQPTLENLVNRLKLDKELLEQYPEDKELLEKRIKQHKEDIANYVTSDRFSYALRFLIYKSHKATRELARIR